MRPHPAVIGLIAALALAACGGGGPPATNGPDTGGTPTAGPGGGGGGGGSESDLEAAARALFEAFQQDDDDTYFAGLADACRAGAGFGIVSERNNSRHARISQAGIDLSAITIDEVAISEFDGSTATVVLALSGTGGNEFLEGQPNPWIFEGGEWHWANCEPFESGGGGGGELGGSGPGDPIGVGFVPTIADWYVYSTYINPNGNDLVAEDGNDPPPAGTVYFLWSISVTYNGPNASATLSDDMSFRLQAGDTVYDAADCGPHPGALELDLVAAPGEGQQGDICHAVATSDVANLFLVVTEISTGRDYWFGQE